MNSIIVSETCTAPPVPIHVPLTQLAPLSQTCFSCPNSVTPHATLTPFALSLTDSPNFQSLAGPPTLNLCTLLLYSPGSQPVGFSLFFRPAEGWKEVDRKAVRAQWWLRRGTFWRWCGWYSPVQCEVVGVEFGRGPFSVGQHNGTMNPQRNVPPNCYYHKKRAAEPI